MNTDACGLQAPPITPSPSPSPNWRRKKSFFDEEEIVVKPSTELIPDEYEHNTDDGVSFHIFTAQSDDHLAENLLETVKSINYQVNESNIHPLNNAKEFFGDLESIKEKSNDKNALVIAFIGLFEKGRDGSLLLEENDASVDVADIWNKFSAHSYPEMKNKPKIFIFCTSQRPVADVQYDSIRHRAMRFDKVYDFPAESDMLIVYKKINDIDVLGHKEEFINQIHLNIRAFSKQYDIIDLLTCCMYANQKFSPLIISTLTRKFYLTPSKERENYLSIVENNSNLEDSLKKIRDNLQKLQDAHKKKKEKKFFSFRKKVDEKPIVGKREEEKTAIEAAVVKREGKTTNVRSSKPPPRVSASSVGSRSRTQSETDFSATKKKPIWRI